MHGVGSPLHRGQLRVHSTGYAGELFVTIKEPSSLADADAAF